MKKYGYVILTTRRCVLLTQKQHSTAGDHVNPEVVFLVFSLSLSSGWHTTVSSLYSYEVVYMLMKEGKNQQCARDTTPTPNHCHPPPPGTRGSG